MARTGNSERHTYIFGQSQKIIRVRLRSDASSTVSSDYHLFRSLENHLNGKTLHSNEAVKNELIQFFAYKNQTFYESGIMKVTER